MKLYRVNPAALEDGFEGHPDGDYLQTGRKIVEQHGYLWTPWVGPLKPNMQKLPQHEINAGLKWYKSVATGEKGAWLDCELIGDDDGDLPSVA